jgi:site-specific DNA-methyltransferase (adenine-specific)
MRAGRNRTINLSGTEQAAYRARLKHLYAPVTLPEVENSTINQDLFEVLPFLPGSFVDLLFIDPPYNLTKSFNGRVFKERDLQGYAEWFEHLIKQVCRLLKPTASLYVCGDWRSSSAMHYVLERYFVVRNRITWEREKGRGAKANWKNNSEDIWYCTVSDDFYFEVEAVKLKRKVVAPYRHENGQPKDWEETLEGDFRVTYPSNIWTDITVPFWSMPENTDHPTQKPEKLLAKIILASSKEGDIIFDPFAGVGTTAVTAKKLGRKYAGIEIDETYCCLAEKRLALADSDKTIQGYAQGVFWERNSLK